MREGGNEGEGRREGRGREGGKEKRRNEYEKVRKK